MIGFFRHDIGNVQYEYAATAFTKGYETVDNARRPSRTTIAFNSYGERSFQAREKTRIRTSRRFGRVH